MVNPFRDQVLMLFRGVEVRSYLHIDGSFCGINIFVSTRMLNYVNLRAICSFTSLFQLLLLLLLLLFQLVRLKIYLVSQ